MAEAARTEEPNERDDRLRRLESLLDDGVLTPQEYAEKRAQVLGMPTPTPVAETTAYPPQSFQLGGEAFLMNASDDASPGIVTAGGAAAGALYGWIAAIILCLGLALWGMIQFGFVGLILIGGFAAFVSPVVAIIFGAMGAAGGAAYGATDGAHPAIRAGAVLAGIAVVGLLVKSCAG